jgi:hypothetical protein
MGLCDGGTQAVAPKLDLATSQRLNLDRQVVGLLIIDLVCRVYW